MASLSLREGTYHVRFRYAGKSFRRSLKTDNLETANIGLYQVKIVLAKLAQGASQIPATVDVGDFIVSGGTSHEPPVTPPPQSTTFADAAEIYLDRLAHLATSHQATKRTHLNNLSKYLKSETGLPLERIGYGRLDGFLQKRLKERSPETVKKERDTVIDFFAWAHRSGYAPANPAQDLPTIKSSCNGDPFRTVAEIEETIARGGLTPEEVRAQWKSLYLTMEEIGEVLRLVRDMAKEPVSFLLHAIAAYTGMRRGEILRLRWQDVDLQNRFVTATSHKQSRQAIAVTRRINLPRELHQILQEHNQLSRRGQLVVTEPGTGKPISKSLSLRLFRQPLRNSRWCIDRKKSHYKIGYHTYRHSFASLLALKKVDQRIIDAYMGHTTEAMRKRYRHLFPDDRRAAVELLQFGVSMPSPDPTGR